MAICVQKESKLSLRGPMWKGNIRVRSKIGVQIPIPRLATEPSPPTQRTVWAGLVPALCPVQSADGMGPSLWTAPLQQSEYLTVGAQVCYCAPNVDCPKAQESMEAVKFQTPPGNSWPSLTMAAALHKTAQPLTIRAHHGNPRGIP